MGCREAPHPLAWCCCVAPLVFRAPEAPAVGPGRCVCRRAAARPRDRHTRACGSEWSISRPALALRTLRRPSHRRRLWSCAHWPGPATAHGHRSQAFRTLRCPLSWQRLVCCALHRLSRRSAMLHVIPLGLLQTVKWHRCNCNVCRRSPKVTVGNYVRLLFSLGPATAHGHRSQAPRPALSAR